MFAPNTVLQQRYQIVRQVGRGGMGAVYEALDQRLGNRVALKQTLIEGERLSRAFEREARLLARMRHPALPHVIDHFNDAGGQFLVMEYIPGDDLATMLLQQGWPFPVTQVLAWAAQLLDALDYLHAQEPPVVHRDIKPQNLKLTSRGEIVLLDFGLAKGAEVMQSRVTSSGSMFGYTPQFAPLEQIQGTGTEPRSDLYALAATLYHLLTDSLPADALTRAAAVLRGQPDPLQPAQLANPQLPAALGQLLQQAMALNPDQRPASAAAMRQALRQLPLTGPATSQDTVVARPPEQPQPTLAVSQMPPADTGAMGATISANRDATVAVAPPVYPQPPPAE